MELYVENIKKLMKEYSMSTKDFAKHIGFSQPSVSKWINGDKYPSYQAIVAICESFNVSSDWLLFGRKQKND